MQSPAVRWEVPACPFPIEFAAEKLEEIRLAVTDQFYALPRGGLEIGGVLFGLREGNELRIQDYRMIECEHLTGPSFLLSEKDRAGLARLLEESAKDEKLAGLAPVGWFHSHTRSGIFLSPQDLEIHETFFPEPQQIALVLRPANLDPTRAGYFFRGADGNMTSECAQEFVVEPVADEGPVHSLRSAKRPVAPVNGAHSVTRERDRAPEHARQEPGGKPEGLAPHEKKYAGLGEPPEPAPRPPRHEPEPVFAAPPPPPPPEPVRRRSFLGIAAALAIISVGVAGYATRDLWMPSAPASLRLDASEAEGKLLIRWNAGSPAIREAASGTLEIRDGGKPISIPLDAAQLGRGFYLFARESEKTFLRLAVSRPGAPAVEDTAVFSGPLPKHVPTPAEIEAQRKAEESKKQQDKMKADLDNQVNRNRQLQRVVKGLRDQMEQQQQQQPKP